MPGGLFPDEAAIATCWSGGRRGTVVNIGSMNGYCGIAELAVYAGTKGALATLTRNAAHAHMADNIRVNAINLGWVATEGERRMQAETLGRGPGWEAEAAAQVAAAAVGQGGGGGKFGSVPAG